METYALFFFALSAGLCIYVYLLKRALKFEQYEREGIQEDYDVLEAKYNYSESLVRKEKEVVERLKLTLARKKNVLGIQDELIKNLQEEIINLKIK